MPIQIICKTCNGGFQVKLSRAKKAKYCSLACKLIGTQTWTMVDCYECGKTHKKFKCLITRNKRNFCSNKCKLANQKMEGHPNWKGGKHMDGHGYYIIKNRHHPEGIYEHRYIYQKKLKRKLKSSEHIHHINGDKTDNRLKNLKLMTNSEHAKEHARLRKNKWSRKYNNCISCNTTKIKHHAHGLCNNCYVFEYRKL